MSEVQEIKTPGIKQREIRPCSICRQPVALGNRVTCIRVRVTRLVVNLPAVRRQTGLEMMLGAAARLAEVLGANEDMLRPLHEEETHLICDMCLLDPNNGLHRLIALETPRAEVRP